MAAKQPNMKRLFLIVAILTATLSASSLFAQGDPAQMRQRMAERMKPQLVEKAKITDAEADKVLDIYVSSMQQRREIRMDESTSPEDKEKKMAALDEEAAKKYKAIPLKDEQVKAISEYFTEMRKNMQNRRQGGGR